MKLGTCRHCGATLLQGSLGCLGCGHLVDDHDPNELTGGGQQTQLGTQVKDALLESRWRLVQPLGRGKKTMAWLAHDVPFDRRVVVKLLDETAAKEPAQVERFEKNAKLLARVDNKNVVAVLALGRHQGVPFVAMRQAEGRSLAEYLHSRNGKVSEAEAAHVVAQLAEAFEAVHREGGPQGGLKPRSIFVSDGQARVTLLDVRAGPDVASEVTEPTTQHTERLEWLAPEMLKGQPATERSDVFTLGCVAWELMNGAPPPRGPLAALLGGSAASVPVMPGELGAVIALATSEDPAARFASAFELQQALLAPASRFAPPEPPTKPVALLPEALQTVPFPAVPEAPHTVPNPTMVGAEVTRPSRASAPRPPAPSAPRSTRASAPRPALPSAPRPLPPSVQRELPTMPSPRQEAEPTRPVTPITPDPAEDYAVREAPTGPRTADGPLLRWGRRDGIIAAAVAIPAIALFLFLSWEKPVATPPPVVTATPAPAPGPEEKLDAELRRAEAKFEARTTPQSVLDRRETFEKTYSDEPGRGKGRLKVKARSRPQISDYLGKERYGELQVIVVYGGHEVSIDVSIDGRRIGPSPIYWPLKPGAHTIKIERAMLEPVVVPVTIIDHKSIRMEIELEVQE